MSMKKLKKKPYNCIHTAVWDKVSVSENTWMRKAWKQARQFKLHPKAYFRSFTASLGFDLSPDQYVFDLHSDIISTRYGFGSVYKVLIKKYITTGIHKYL
jgi:hypothetical protein